MAERMAGEIDDVARSTEPGMSLADIFAVLLSDLDRPASRDEWIRWGIARRPDYPWREDPIGLRAAILEVPRAE